MKYPLLGTLICISAIASAQTIANGDFEEWKTRDHFKPTGWFSPNLNVQRSTDAKQGNYAIKLINKKDNKSRGYIKNSGYSNNQEINGDAISGDVLSVSFWSKFNLAVGDTAHFYMYLREKGTDKGRVDFRFTGNSANEYVKFTIPITWSLRGDYAIDSVWIYLYSSVGYNVDGDGYVIFDDIAFESIGKRVGTFDDSGFEDWYNIGVEYPESWRSLDLLMYDTYTSFLTTPSCVRESNTRPEFGNNSLSIKNYVRGTGIAKGYAFWGEDNNIYAPHIPFIDTFKYLQGYYKYMPDGPDTARIKIRTYANGSIRSNNSLSIHQKAEDWTYFSIPLTYSAISDPDSASLVFFSAEDQGGKYGAETALTIDNLSFVKEESPIVLGIPLMTSTPTYYPNPTSGLFTIQSTAQYSKATCTDRLGRSIDLPVHQNTIDLREQRPGLYFISLYSADHLLNTLKVYRK